jgi:hypothetical protein
MKVLIVATIFLYVKQHNITGLKYFGKTTRKDPKKYKGSGKYWQRHLKKHGDDITTTDVWHFDNQHEASEFAVKFSIENQIVESPEWANLIIENAFGGVKGYTHTNESRKKMSESSKGNKHRLGKSFTSESRRKMSLSHSNKVLSDTHKKNISVAKRLFWTDEQRHKHSLLQQGRGIGQKNSQYGKKWMTDGIINKSVYPEEISALVELGFRPGRIINKR